MSPTIVLAVDETKPQICESARQDRIRLSKLMFEEGWHVVSVTSKSQFYEKVNDARNITAIILNDTEREKGKNCDFSELRSLRNCTSAPILMITSAYEEKDELEILNSGIDGLLRYPVSDSMIIAYIRNMIKRTGPAPIKKITYGGLHIDKAAHIVKVDDVSISLTPKEFDLLCYFAQNPNLALTRYQILNNAWGAGYDGSERTVDSHIKSLRCKLGKSGKQIETIRSVGYKFIGNQPSESEPVI